MRFAASALILCVLHFITLSTAWPWPPSREHVGGLLGRQESSSSEGSRPSETAAASASSGASASITARPTASAAASSASASGSAAASTAAATSGMTATRTTGRSSHRSSETTSISVDPRLPPGGIEMVTPAITASTSYYKVGDYVTFKWDYTSLSVTPSAIDVMASCALNQQLYTIALNQSVEPTGAVTWDTGGYQATATVPLLTESYTLVIYDAAKDVSATAEAGHLGVANTFVFGMYIPQKYTPLEDFQCATCSAAMSHIERQALGFTVGMATITLLSFTWFVGGFGALF